MGVRKISRTASLAAAPGFAATPPVQPMRSSYPGGCYLVDDHGIFDTGDHPDSTATLGAGFYVDIEHPLQALRSDHRQPG